MRVSVSWAPFKLGHLLWPTHQGTFYTLLSRKWNNCRKSQWTSLLSFLPLTLMFFVVVFSQSMLCHFPFHILQMFPCHKYNPCAFWCPSRPFMTWPLATSITLSSFMAASSTHSQTTNSNLAIYVVHGKHSLTHGHWNGCCLCNWMEGSFHRVSWLIPSTHSGFCTNVTC